MTRAEHSPALPGGLIALTAAVLFGVSTPPVQRFGSGIRSFTTATLLYPGAALIGALIRRPIGITRRWTAASSRRAVTRSPLTTAEAP